MLDKTSKCLLAIIAAALVMIALDMWVQPGTAQLSGPCGTSKFNSCYVTVDGPIEVFGTVETVR